VFSTHDTIVAIATPPGRGGIGVVRLSGPDAHAIASRLTNHERPFEPRRATVTMIRAGEIGLKPDPTSSGASAQGATSSRESAPCAIDQVVVTFFQAPGSYTGDDVIEISAHGSPVILRSIVTAAIDLGARLAEPGEFTLRAYVNGRIDLMQAEAVADLIDAVTPLQARVAFDQLQGTLTRAIGEIDAALFDLIARLEASVDFPDEGYHFVDPGSLAQSIDAIAGRTRALLADARRGRLVREGLQIAIVGRPNVGKSSLFNALAGASRAIVTAVPGTTRDLVSETVDLDGLRATLIDTAGLRDTVDVVESEGVARTKGAAAVADLVLVVADRSRPLRVGESEDFTQSIENKALIVANKSDLPAAWSRADAVDVSAVTGEGLSRLRRRIHDALDVERLTDRPELTNVRHIALVQRAHDALARARTAALGDGHSLSEEFVLADLQEARAALEEVAGKRMPDDLLTHIFARFCVGK
jgi:tRNA modification GTPase